MKNKIYEITLISKDKHYLIFKTSAISKEEAINKVYERLKELWYDNYDYKVYNIKVLNKIENV